MPISDSVCKAPAPSAGRFTLANLVLGPISVKFQNWTYVQDTVLFLHNESFWRVFNTVCMGLWTRVVTAVPCPTLVEVALGGHNPSHSGPVGGQRGKSRWTHLRQERCSGCMLHLHAAVHSTRSLRNIVQDLGGVL